MATHQKYDSQENKNYIKHLATPKCYRNAQLWGMAGKVGDCHLIHKLYI